MSKAGRENLTEESGRRWGVSTSLEQNTLFKISREVSTPLTVFQCDREFGCLGEFDRPSRSWWSGMHGMYLDCHGQLYFVVFFKVGRGRDLM